MSMKIVKHNPEGYKVTKANRKTYLIDVRHSEAIKAFQAEMKSLDEWFEKNPIIPVMQDEFFKSWRDV